MSVPVSRSGLLVAGVLLALNAAAAETGTSLTVYSSAHPGAIPAEWYRPLPGMGTPMANQLPGFALVRLERELQVPRGRGTIQFSDVAALIDPTTVQFLSLTDPEGTKVAERFLGRLPRAHGVAVDMSDLPGEGRGHAELVYDFRDGGGADGWLHALVRFEDRATDADSSEMRKLAEKLDEMRAERASLEVALTAAKADVARLGRELEAARIDDTARDRIAAENEDLRKRISDLADTIMRSGARETSRKPSKGSRNAAR